MIKMIWCCDKNNGVGLDNLLPWQIKEEMQHFISETLNKTVVMGENTFKSIGRPLKNRTNIVLSDDINFKADEVIVYNDYKKILADYKDKEIIIIGGISIYNLFFKYADELIVSRLHKEYKCNRFLNFDFKDFEIKAKKMSTCFDTYYYSRMGEKRKCIKY